MKERAPLTGQRAMETALRLADAGGIESLSMRRLAKELGVEAASLYHHVRNKDEILDGLVELVSGEMAALPGGVDWKAAMRERSRGCPGGAEAPSLGGQPDGLAGHRGGQATLGHLDAGIGCLRGAGFSVPMAGHAISLIDSYVHGFVLQEVNLPFDDSAGLTEVTTDIMEAFPGATSRTCSSWPRGTSC